MSKPASALTNTTCQACWDKTAGGPNNPHCKYCDGEGYMWSERIIKICFFRGVAPIYKPGTLATGQYPQTDAGYLATDRATAFCEYKIFPNYERDPGDQQARYDMLYELKVDANGRTVSPLVRTARWAILSARLGESLFPACLPLSQSAAGSGCSISLNPSPAAASVVIRTLAKTAYFGLARRGLLPTGWRCGNGCCHDSTGAER